MRQQFRKAALINVNLERKRKGESPNEEIGDELIAWFNRMRLLYPINVSIAPEQKATLLSENL